MADSLGTDAGDHPPEAGILTARQPRTIFAEDWWLDAAAPGRWGRVETHWDGVLVGEMDYCLTQRWGLRYLGMPHLTRTMSPRLSPPPAKPAMRLMLTQSIVGELIDKLPRHDRFERALDPGCLSVQGFVQRNFAVTHMFTFRSNPGDTPETMMSGAHHEARRAIRKAQRECTIEPTLDLDRFIRLHRGAYGKESLVDYKTLERLFEAAASRGQARILLARLGGARDVAAMVVVWDHQSVYTWLLARDNESKHVGASSLLSYEAMKIAHDIGRILDLDGYVTPAVGLFLTKFGLQPVVRPYVNGASPMWQALRSVTTALKPRRIDRHYRVS